MKYVAVVAKLDGFEDLMGEVLGKDVILPKHAIEVCQDFNKNLPILGKAVVKKIEDDLVAYLDIDLIPDIATKFYAVVGGSVLKRDGRVVKKWKLNGLALTAYPSDRRIGTLREPDDNEFPKNTVEKNPKKKRSKK